MAAVNHIVEAHPEIEVFVLSKYFTNSDYALNEKDEWVSEHLPGIDEAHRIFVPYEMDKRDMIPDKLQETDYLLDDYTKNFDNWQPPARGIKLLNGINHTKGTWQDNRISLMRDPKGFAECLVNIITKGEQIRDRPPQQEDKKPPVQENQEEAYSKVLDEMMAECEPPEPDFEI